MPHNHPEGVPLNLWLVAADGGGSCIRRRLADRAVQAFSPTGGLVVDLNPDRGEGLAAAVATGRAAVSLPPAAVADGRLRSAALSGLASPADLVLALPGSDDLHRPTGRALTPLAARVLAEQAAPLLQPGGLLVLGSVPAPGTGHDPVTDAVEATTAEGFSYFQHVVALLAPDATERPTAHVDVLVFARRES
jgi:hypothetical protein